MLGGADSGFFASASGGGAGTGGASAVLSVGLHTGSSTPMPLFSSATFSPYAAGVRARRAPRRALGDPPGSGVYGLFVFRRAAIELPPRRRAAAPPLSCFLV